MRSLVDCAICKKLKPLTFIHAKHCVSAPGERCVIPYCARAKRELQLLMQRRTSNAEDARLPASAVGNAQASEITAVSSTMSSGADDGNRASSAARQVGMLSGTAPAAAALETMNTQAQAHYLLILAHVMKCARSYRFVELV